MTTMMTVALAFVAVLITAFIIVLVFWKKDSKQRNESIRALEKRLDEVVHELADGNKINSTTKNDISDENMDRLIRTLENMSFIGAISEVDEVNEAQEDDIEIEDVGDEISFDFLELDGFEMFEDFETEKEPQISNDFEIEDDFEIDIGLPEEYNTGRSGKKYTAEELEALIKE
ncbi:MAG: hypothetical protein Q4B18_03330 [Bacillota bacterium]|nr:hypothetical protein [Bacillota bacterium]